MVVATYRSPGHVIVVRGTSTDELQTKLYRELMLQGLLVVEAEVLGTVVTERMMAEAAAAQQ